MTTTTTIACLNCNGLGILAKFMHIDNGVCYACGGEGVVDASKAPRASVKGTPNPAARLREIYAAGASRTGASRTDWLESICEPYDTISKLAPIDTVRACLAAVDVTTATKATVAFKALGVNI